MRWFSRKDREKEIDRELRAHLELEAEEQQDRGLSAEEARHAARRKFGSRALAFLIPARRITQLDPARVLQSE